MPKPPTCYLCNDKRNCKDMIGKITLAAVGIMMPGAAFAQEEKALTNFEDTTMTLQEVTVKSPIPRTRVKGDAMRTIVTGSILEKAGKGVDVLNRIPQLKADKDGSVEVFGRGNAEVYINGRKVVDLKELARIQSDHIKTVDVIQNPGARYAANVKAVVRITLKKNKGEGFGFVDGGEIGYKYGSKMTNNLDLNYRKGGFDVTGSFWCGYDYTHKSLQRNDMTYYVGNDLYSGNSNQNTRLKWTGWSPQLQVNYMFDDNHSVGGFYKFDNRPYQSWKGVLNTDIYGNGEFSERSESELWQSTTFKKHIFNAYYNGKVGKLGIDVNVDGVFDKTNDPNGTNEKTVMADGTETLHKVDNLTKSKNRFWAAKLIFSYPVWQGNLSIGGEYSHNNRTDAYSFTAEESLPVKATDTNIREAATAGFVEYGRNFGRLYVQVGLRYEYMNTGYYEFGEKQKEMSRKYGDWFPTAVVSMPVGQVQLSLSYRKDIERPAYSQLTNSTIYINRYSFQAGNPYLRPTYTSNLALNAAWHAFNMTVSYAHTKDVVTMLTEHYPGSDDPTLNLIHPVNGEKGYDQWVISPSYRPVIGKWHPLWSVGFIAQNYKTPTATEEEITLNRPFWQFVWNNDIELPAHFRINASAQLTTKGDYNNFRMTENNFNVTMGVQRDFNLKALGLLTADLRCYDIFNTGKTGVTIFGPRELTNYNPGRRFISLDVTWKFNEARSKYRGTGAGKGQKARL